MQVDDDIVDAAHTAPVSEEEEEENDEGGVETEDVDMSPEEELARLLRSLADSAMDPVPLAPGGALHQMLQGLAGRLVNLHRTGPPRPLQDVCNFDVIEDLAPAVLLGKAYQGAPKRSYVYMAPCRSNKTLAIITLAAIASMLRLPTIIVVCDQKANSEDVARKVSKGLTQLLGDQYRALTADAKMLDDFPEDEVERVRDGRSVLVLHALHYPLRSLVDRALPRLRLNGAMVQLDESDGMWSGDTRRTRVLREKFIYEMLEMPGLVRSIAHISATQLATTFWHSMMGRRYSAHIADDARLRERGYVLDDVLRAPLDEDGQPIYLVDREKVPAQPRKPTLKRKEGESDAAYQTRYLASQAKKATRHTKQRLAHMRRQRADKAIMDKFIERFATLPNTGRMMMLATTPFMEGKRAAYNTMGRVKEAIQIAARAIADTPGSSTGPALHVPVGLVIWGGGGRIFTYKGSDTDRADGFEVRDTTTEEALKWLGTVPPDVPVIVSGYTCIKRSINVAHIDPDRPEISRVITHMLLAVTKGMSVPDVYQLFMRCGGLTQGPREFHMGHAYVEVLTFEEDLKLVRSLPNLMKRMLIACQDDVDAWRRDPEALELKPVADQVRYAVLTGRRQGKARLGTWGTRSMGPMRIQMKRYDKEREEQERRERNEAAMRMGAAEVLAAAAAMAQEEVDEVDEEMEVDAAKWVAWARRQEDPARVLLVAMVELAEGKVVMTSVMDNDRVMAAGGISDEAVRSRLLVTVRAREWAELVDNSGVYRLTDAGLAEYRAARQEATGGSLREAVLMWEQLVRVMYQIMDAQGMVTRQQLIAHPVTKFVNTSHNHLATTEQKGYITRVDDGVYKLTASGIALAHTLRGL